MIVYCYCPSEGRASELTEQVYVPVFLEEVLSGLFFYRQCFRNIGGLCLMKTYCFFTGHKHMWSVPNAFIVNISISDFLMTVFNCIFNYIYMRDRDWIFSDAYCVFNNFIAICTVAASVFSLSAMSINRYVSMYLGSLSTLFYIHPNSFKKASSSLFFFQSFFRNVISTLNNK